MYIWRWGLFPHHVNLTLSGQSKSASPTLPALSLIWELHWREWLALNSLPISFRTFFWFISKNQKQQSSKLQRGIRKEPGFSFLFVEDYCLLSLPWQISFTTFWGIFLNFFHPPWPITQIQERPTTFGLFGPTENTGFLDPQTFFVHIPTSLLLKQPEGPLGGGVIS